MLTCADVFFHGSSQNRVDVAIQIIRDVSPHVFAADYHGFAPFSKDALGLQLPPSPGANRSRNISRARNSRVLTDAVDIPSAFAVSSMLKCCISRNTKTSRYFAASEARASANFCRTSFRS